MNNNNNDSDDDDELTGFVNNSRFTPIEPPYIQPSNPATSVFAQNTITVPSVQPPQCTKSRCNRNTQYKSHIKQQVVRRKVEKNEKTTFEKKKLVEKTKKIVEEAKTSSSLKPWAHFISAFDFFIIHFRRFQRNRNATYIR